MFFTTPNIGVLYIIIITILFLQVPVSIAMPTLVEEPVASIWIMLVVVAVNQD